MLRNYRYSFFNGSFDIFRNFCTVVRNDKTIKFSCFYYTTFCAVVNRLIINIFSLWNGFLSVSSFHFLRLTDCNLNNLVLRNRSVTHRRLSLVLRLYLALIHLLLALITPENGLALLGIDLVDEVFEVLLGLSQLGFGFFDVVGIGNAVDLSLRPADCSFEGSLLLFQLITAL